MRFDGFTSGFYSFPSLNAAAQTTMNYYPDLVEGSLPNAGVPQGAEKARKVLTPTPGLDLYMALAADPCRALWAGENRLFVVYGLFLYEVKGPASLVSHGSVGNDGAPAQMFGNGDQLLVVSAGQAYCDTGYGVAPCQFSTQLYDLVIEPSTGAYPGALTGDTGGIFDASDVHCTVVITGGAGFNQGTFTITAVNGDGSAVGSASWGTEGSVEGTGYENLWVPRSLTGLSIDASTGGLEVPGGFGALDVGAIITVDYGTGFDFQSQAITSVNASGEAFGEQPWGTPGSTGGEATETLPQYVTAAQGAFLDGTFFALDPYTMFVYYSALNDGTSWDPLQFFRKEAYPDSVAAIIADHEQIYLLGSLESTEVWYDTGSGTNPFQRNPSYFMHYGCQAPWSVCRLSTGVAWIGGDVKRGSRVAFLAIGYVPQRISTAAIEKAWGAYATVDDAVAFSRIQDGHEFWEINFPTANATWVYDATLGEWHQKGWWNGTGWDRQRAAFHACIGIGTIDEAHFVGDWQNGNLYTMAAAYTQDNGTAIHRRRRAPHLSNENKRRFYSLFELDCDTAEADLDNAPPRVRWLPLGSSRDRIYQVDDDGAGNLTLSYSDDRCLSFTERSPIAVASGAAAITLVAAYVDLVEGTG